MRPSTTAFKKRYNQGLLEAVDWAMEVDPLLRPQTVDAMLETLPQATPASDSDEEQDKTRDSA